MSSGGSIAPDSIQVRAWADLAVERGHAAWPGVEVSHEEMVRVARLRLSTPAADGAEVALDRLDGAELFLAAACARGDRRALAQLRARYFDPLAESLRGMGIGPSQCDDIWQILCERLLVGEPPPRIVRYAGAGELRGLVRVAATRAALNWREREQRRAGDDDWLDGLPSGKSDPELHAMKRQHLIELKQELEAAVAGLSARDRMMLRLHLVERVGIDAIAVSCSIHRSTAARAIARAKETLIAGVRARLIGRWKVPDAELAALVTLVDSQIDLSLERVLAAC